MQECSDTHELALRRISELEHELSRAHNTITQLESAKSSERSANTCSLYDELVGSASGSCNQPMITIDLTNDTLVQNKITKNTIRDIFQKYEDSQQDLTKRLQEACELVDLVIQNAEKYDLLTNNISCNCSCLPTSEAHRVTPTQVPQCVSPSQEPQSVTTLATQFEECSDKVTSIQTWNDSIFLILYLLSKYILETNGLIEVKESIMRKSGSSSA
ncbi:hypothetical protein B5X24_HaOG214989 [Helicoverpa armigera]|nr:hypothetical protein B5X24_HaOG214989 [Helicoverpa armigera]